MALVSYRHCYGFVALTLLWCVVLAMCVPISTLVVAAGHMWVVLCFSGIAHKNKSTLLNFVRAKFRNALLSFLVIPDAYQTVIRFQQNIGITRFTFSIPCIKIQSSYCKPTNAHTSLESL